MSWSIGYDDNWKRDIGYGVPSACDYPGCGEEIHRGLAYVCGGDAYGGERGCGLFFCDEHRACAADDNEEYASIEDAFEAIEMAHEDGEIVSLCERCRVGADPFTATPDSAKWIDWKLTDESWGQWRNDNPEWVKEHTHGKE
jgi:hypothetical protein